MNIADKGATPAAMMQARTVMRVTSAYLVSYGRALGGGTGVVHLHDCTETFFPVVA